jgi:hypothetical protein
MEKEHFHIRNSEFSLREEMFITLVRLRVVADMANRYGFAESTYSSIFTA